MRQKMCLIAECFVKRASNGLNEIVLINSIFFPDQVEEAILESLSREEKDYVIINFFVFFNHNWYFVALPQAFMMVLII